MPIKIGYKLCIDCKTPIEKKCGRKRCEKCQEIYANANALKWAERRRRVRIATCIHCQAKFQARSSSHKICDQCHRSGRGTKKAQITQAPTRVVKERISALPLASLQGDRFARAVTAFIRAANG